MFQPPGNSFDARRQCGLALVAAALGVAYAAPMALGQLSTTLDAKKKVTWHTKKLAVPKTGKFEWKLYAQGTCAPVCDENETVGPGVSEWNVATGAWAVPPGPQPPPAGLKDTGLQDCSVGKAQAKLACVVAAADPVLGADLVLIKTSLEPWTFEYEDVGGTATATVEGSVKVPGCTAFYTTPGDRSGKVSTTAQVVKISGDGASFKDPIWLELHQEGAGLVASQKLFSLDVFASRDATLIWDDTIGILMEVPLGAGAEVTIAGAYPGSWITGPPGPFGATLTGGQFTPIGAWAGLPWAVSVDEGMLRAELPAAALPALELDYVIPASLITPGTLYFPVLVYTVAQGDGAAPCYADCSQDGQLTVSDFGCFQMRFVASDPYADCDSSGSFTIADFACFQSQFVIGCP